MRSGSFKIWGVLFGHIDHETEIRNSTSKNKERGILVTFNDPSEGNLYHVRQDGVEVGRFADRGQAFNWAATLSWEGAVEVWFESELLWTNVVPPFRRILRAIGKLFRRPLSFGTTISYEIRQDGFVIGTADDLETGRMRAILLSSEGETVVLEVRRRVLSKVSPSRRAL